MTNKARNTLSSIILFTLLLCTNIYACFTASDLSSPGKVIAYLFVVCLGLIIPMLVFRRRTYFIVCGILYLFCAPIEISCLYLNHNPATATYIGLFYATNWKEVVGIIHAVWPLLIGLITSWVIYFVIAYKQPNEWIIPRKKSLWAIAILFPILTIGALFFYSRYARDIYNIQDKKEAMAFAKELTLMKFYKIFPYNIYLNTLQIANEKRALKQAEETLKPFLFNIESLSDSTAELYILVIGESARSDNFSLNGYHRITTPRLAQRSNLISFPHIYSQAGTTETAVPHMISRVPITEHHLILSEKTLPETFQEAGYNATWLTNQSRAQYLQRILDAMDSKFETGKDMSVTNNYDEYLLAPLQNTISEQAQKQFVVVHTMGSHWRYDTRYPQSFERFSPSIGENFTLSMITPSNRQILINAYDNTILYTDYFLDSIISIVEKQHIPSLVMYMSDHGENLYDDERNLVLHGNYGTSKWLFHVPFIIWYSDEYAELNPEKIEQMNAHINTRDNSSILFHSMIDAANLRYLNDTASNTMMCTRSIFSKNYRSPDSLFVLTTEGDYVVLEK